MTGVFFFLATATRHVGSQFPDQGLNLCPLQWKCGVLTTGPPGKSLTGVFKIRRVATQAEIHRGEDNTKTEAVAE